MRLIRYRCSRIIEGKRKSERCEGTWTGPDKPSECPVCGLRKDARFECRECDREPWWDSPGGHVNCSTCGSPYCTWVNYDEWRVANPMPHPLRGGRKAPPPKKPRPKRKRRKRR